MLYWINSSMEILYEGLHYDYVNKQNRLELCHNSVNTALDNEESRTYNQILSVRLVQNIGERYQDE